jgi:hypothetical protein
MIAEQMVYEYYRLTGQIERTNRMKSDDVYYFLNQAQEQFIEERWNKNLTERNDFQTIQKEVDDLRVLAKSTQISVSSLDDYQHGTLPDDYRHAISVHAFVRKNAQCPIINSQARIVRQSELYAILLDPFSKSSLESPVTTIVGNSLRIYPNGFTISGVILSYIKTPVVIGSIDNGNRTGCELSPHTHPEIVRIAVQLSSNVLPNFINDETNSDSERRKVRSI